MFTPPLLAGIDIPSGDTLVIGFSFLVFLMLIIDKGLSIYQKATGKVPGMAPQPFMVRQDEDTVSDGEFNKFVAQDKLEKDGLHKELLERFDKLQKARSESIAHLHDHIRGAEARVRQEVKELSERTLEQIAAVGTRLNGQGERIARVEERQNMKGKQA